MQRHSLPSSFLASVLSFASAFALGCVISVGPGGDDAGSHECGSLLANNDSNCVCLPGYERCNPGTSDTDCCEKQGKGGECDANSYLDGDQCFCNEGYTWCNPDDDNDLSCCVDPGQGTQGTTEGETDGTTEPVPTTSEGTTGQPPEECLEAVEPPASCDPEAGENFFCTNPDSCGPYGSKKYFCQNGLWVEMTQDELDQECQFDAQGDFAYGCVDTPQGVDNVCGYGSGAACDPGPASCADETTWAFCQYGKQTEVDCYTICTEIGDDQGATYDYGSCEIQRGEAVCACCDEGDEGCPINERETDTDTDG
jgi:hypothetical protein